MNNQDTYRRASINCDRKVADKINNFIISNADLELSTTINEKNNEEVELVIYGRNMGKTIFNRKMILLLIRSLYRPPAPEYDVKAGLNNLND